MTRYSKIPPPLAYAVHLNKISTYLPIQMVYNFHAHSRHYEWDPAKARSNLEKHDIDFASVSEFEWETAVIRRSDRRGETRLTAYGYMQKRLHSLAFTIREDRIRIISFRKANVREERYYAQAQT